MTVFEFKLVVVVPSLYNCVACTLPSQKVLKRNPFGVFHFVNPTNFGLARSVCIQFFVFFVVVLYKVILVTSVSSIVDYFPDDPTPSRNKYLG